jgi:hypothetical protein
MQQHQHHYIDRRRLRLMDSSNKTRNDEFYAKLERLRSTAAASSSKSFDFNNKLILLSKSHFSSSRSQSNKIVLFFPPPLLFGWTVFYCVLIMMRQQLCANRWLGRFDVYMRNVNEANMFINPSWSSFLNDLLFHLSFYSIIKKKTKTRSNRRDWLSDESTIDFNTHLM